MPMRTSVWGAPQDATKHRFPRDCKLLAMTPKKLYNDTHAVRPQAVV